VDLAIDLLKENRRHVAVILVLSLATGGLSSALITVTARGVSAFGSDDFPWLAVAFVALCALTLAGRYGHRYVVTVVSNRLELTLRSRLSATIRACSLRALESRRHAELMAVLTYDVESVCGFVLALPTMLSSLALLLGALVYLGYAVGIWALAVLAALVAGALAHGYVVVDSMPVFRSLRERQACLMKAYEDLTLGIKDLKMDESTASRLFTHEIAPVTSAIAQLHMEAMARHTTALNALQVTLYVLLCAVVFAFPLLADVAPETSATCVIVILFAFGPAESIANLHPLFGAARAALLHIRSLEHELAAAPDATTAPRPAPFQSIELTAVTFVYRENGAAVDDAARIGPLSLSIRCGELLFVTGGNGSGKTTLAKLLCGLYVPDAGAVRLNSELVGSASLPTLRQHFSVVFGDSHVPGAAIDPATLADPHATELATALHVHHILRTWDTRSLEDLSSGQRRRLALFAALSRQRDIYLLDEPAANLDADAKIWLYRTLLPRLHAAGATVIVISHDEQFFDMAGRVVTLREGVIASDSSREVQPGASQA
jgi:putative pyoverdin transport system ATP-binding/permease protein